MAKDILVNPQSGDVIMSGNNPTAIFFNVVWGRLFASDEMEYMNIVVPSGYINSVQYSDGKYECYVHAAYNPVNTTFLARLVVKDVAMGGYRDLRDFNTLAPAPTGCVYYPRYSGRPESLMACMLSMIDVDGNFLIQFKRYSNSNFTRAIVSAANILDFEVGLSDNQEVQLLSRCAPGKSYRYPTTGIDLTKYINSVVSHTDMSDRLIKELEADFRNVVEAEFDSSTGNLDVIFNGTREADDTNLTPVSKLDVELLRIADDDYIRTVNRAANGVVMNPNEFVEDVQSYTEFLGIFDINGEAKKVPYADEATWEISKYIGHDGKISSNSNFCVCTVPVEANRIYEIALDLRLLSVVITAFRYNYYIPFALYNEDGVPIYICPDISQFPNQANPYYDPPFTHGARANFCFIPRVNCMMKYIIPSSYFNKKDTVGIFPLATTPDNYKSMVALVSNPITGAFQGVISADSLIDDVQIYSETNQIIVIKQNQ